MGASKKPLQKARQPPESRPVAAVPTNAIEELKLKAKQRAANANPSGAVLSIEEQIARRKAEKAAPPDPMAELKKKMAASQNRRSLMGDAQYAERVYSNAAATEEKEESSQNKSQGDFERRKAVAAKRREADEVKKVQLRHEKAKLDEERRKKQEEDAKEEREKELARSKVRSTVQDSFIHANHFCTHDLFAYILLALSLVLCSGRKRVGDCGRRNVVAKRWSEHG